MDFRDCFYPHLRIRPLPLRFRSQQEEKRPHDGEAGVDLHWRNDGQFRYCSIRLGGKNLGVKSTRAVLTGLRAARVASKLKHYGLHSRSQLRAVSALQAPKPAVDPAL